MEPPSVCGNRMAAFTAVYLQNGAPSGYSINLQFDNYTQQANVSQALLSFQVFRNLGYWCVGECSVCANLCKSETDKQANKNARTVSTLQNPDFDITHFLWCVKKARNPISSPDVCISSSRSSHIGIHIPLIQ